MGLIVVGFGLGKRAGRGALRLLKRPARFMLVYAALAVAMGLLFMRIPGSFLPDEDQGVLMTMVQAPTGATQ